MSIPRWSVRALACVLPPMTVGVAALHASTARRASSSVAARPAELVGLYRLDVPEARRPSARLRYPATEVTFLRLLADGRARLENVTLADQGGVVAARVARGPTAARPWAVRTPSPGGRPAPALAQLCVPQAGGVTCERYERDAVTGDLVLYAGASAASATLRLERVRTP